MVESLLGKCHEENDLLFFTIRPDSGLEGAGSGGLTAGSGSSSRRNSWVKVPKFITGGGGGGGGGDGATRGPTVGLTFEIGRILQIDPRVSYQECLGSCFQGNSRILGIFRD